jgi:putative endonuclease
MKTYYVYIMASQRNGTLYVGMTNNLQTRVYQHKNNLVDGFTKEHNVHLLVYFEQSNDINAALTREKQIKHWKRAWKLRLIEESNSNWKDLGDDF